MIYLPDRLSICISVRLPFHLSNCQTVLPFVYQSDCHSFCISVRPSFHLSNCQTVLPSIYLSNCTSICLTIRLSILLFISQTVLPSVYQSDRQAVCWTHTKRSSLQMLIFFRCFGSISKVFQVYSSIYEVRSIIYFTLWYQNILYKTTIEYKTIT